MTYAFTARPLTPQKNPVNALTGALYQIGIDVCEVNLSRFPGVDEVVEQTLIDVSYSIDAPDALPAGACYGIPMGPYSEFACAAQQEVKR